jgi:hypothetical protein
VCPASTGVYSCLTANDDSVGCGNGRQSRLNFLASPGSAYAVLVSGFTPSAADYTLSWAYGLPTPTASATPSRTSNFVPQCFNTAATPRLAGSFSGSTVGGNEVGFGGTCNGVSFSALTGVDLLLGERVACWRARSMLWSGAPWHVRSRRLSKTTRLTPSAPPTLPPSQYLFPLRHPLEACSRWTPARAQISTRRSWSL